jgi:hypothetical protein
MFVFVLYKNEVPRMKGLQRREPPSSAPQTNLFRQLKRSINARHGPLVYSTIITLLRCFKYSSRPLDPDGDAFFNPHLTLNTGPTASACAVKHWDGHGLPSAVCLRIMEKSYQRGVGRM